MKPGHAAFSKAASKPNHAGRAQEIGGGLVVADAAASAPVLRAGRKSPTSVIGASPKVQARRYQGELTRAMQEGKLDAGSGLKTYKTPSGRYLNAGGTHRHLARQAMGQPSKLEVKTLDYEPKFSLKAKLVNQHKIKELKRGSEDALAGRNKPVSLFAREANKHLAAAADVNDHVAWEAGHYGGGRTAMKAAERAGHVNAGVGAALGAGVIGAGILEHRAEQKKRMAKAVDGHDAFEISKRNRNTSLGRDVTGAMFPGIHGAVAGKPGHKVKAAAYELGGNFLVPGIGGGVGTHIASQQGHYLKLKARKKKIAKRDFSTGQREKLAAKGDALPDGSFPIKSRGDLKNAEKLEGHSKHPAEVAALIERKKAELSKAATGHEAFLFEDVEKAFSLGGAMDAVKGVGAIGRGLVKQPGIVKPGAGVHRGAGKVGGFLKPKVLKPGGGFTTGAKVAGATAGVGAGYKIGMGARNKFGN